MTYVFKREFALDESGDPEKDFEILDTLGKGYVLQRIKIEINFRNFGAVYLGKHKTSGTLVAIKKLVIVEDEDFEEILKEIEIMKQCESAYVVTYYGSYWRREENEMWVREFCN